MSQLYEKKLKSIFIDELKTINSILMSIKCMCACVIIEVPNFYGIITTATGQCVFIDKLNT
ncbi:hypothetical protein BpHYR1_014054 [Brachionus plicatilis]|uniref:Uncharacterized protein n=1 Tax=Brachionus plicatilis TaxID=10195 RepID=A0A3M7T651_BRAPC|nr:hypothetical protein BpHYR1_014054 [Brachionus plicatilis]